MFGMQVNLYTASVRIWKQLWSSPTLNYGRTRPNSRSPIFTARIRSLQRLCFHRCLSMGGCLPHCMLGYTPPGQTPLGTPARQTHTPSQTHPLSRQSPWADTPGHTHTPRQTPPVHAGIHPPAQCMMGYTHHPSCAVHARIWSTSGCYTSHWNAFLLGGLCLHVNHPKS